MIFGMGALGKEVKHEQVAESSPQRDGIGEREYRCGLQQSTLLEHVLKAVACLLL